MSNDLTNRWSAFGAEELEALQMAIASQIPCGNARRNNTLRAMLEENYTEHRREFNR